LNGQMEIESKRLNTDALDWLLEADPNNPGVRFFALRDLSALPAGDLKVRQAQSDVMASGPVPAILDAQYPAGYWVKPGGGYSPSYRATIWQIIFLAELGADPTDEHVRRGCEYLLGHSIAASGGFSMSQRPVPSSVVHCLNGDLLCALLRLGYSADPRVQAALDWQTQAITGQDGVRYYKSGTSGPGFECGYNQGQPCAWGATKVIKALASVPPQQRTPAVERAIQAGVQFLLSHDLAVADYPYTERINSSWFRFGFPLSYRSDILETADALAQLGYAADPRLANARQFILSKRDKRGHWKMETSLNGKMWTDVEEKGKPSKWVTLRAMRVLMGAGELRP
jgi:hypothetical protein